MNKKACKLFLKAALFQEFHFYITEFEFCSVKQNTVEEFEFEWSRCGKNLKSSIPVVNATTHPRSAGRNFVALSFLVNGHSLPQNSRNSRSGRRRFNFTQWIHIAE